MLTNAFNPCRATAEANVFALGSKENVCHNKWRVHYSFFSPQEVRTFFLNTDLSKQQQQQSQVSSLPA